MRIRQRLEIMNPVAQWAIAVAAGLGLALAITGVAAVAPTTWRFVRTHAAPVVAYAVEHPFDAVVRTVVPLVFLALVWLTFRKDGSR